MEGMHPGCHLKEMPWLVNLQPEGHRGTMQVAPDSGLEWAMDCISNAVQKVHQAELEKQLIQVTPCDRIRKAVVTYERMLRLGNPATAPAGRLRTSEASSFPTQ